MDSIDYLADKIGVRFAGTENDQKAAGYIADQFKECGLEVEIDKFSFLGWELLEEPKLKLVEPSQGELPCVALIYAAPTGEEGVRGKVEARGKRMNYWFREITSQDRYALISDSNEDVGYLFATDEEEPVSALGEELPFTSPQVLIGKKHGERIKRMLENGERVIAELKINSRFRPGDICQNVIGTLKGKKPRSFIIISSHYDTVYDSPGANDDASAVQVLMLLAERLQGRALPCSIKFLAYGAEEIGLLGSRHYAKRLMETGTMKNVIAVINLDEIGVKKQNHRFRASNQVLKNKLVKVLKKLRAEEKLGDMEDIVEKFPMKNVTISWNSDYAPFAQEGVPTISIGGEDMSTHHKTNDTADIVDRETVKYKSIIVENLIEQLYSDVN